jgi:uncharacterized protein YkwD
VRRSGALIAALVATACSNAAPTPGASRASSSVAALLGGAEADVYANRYTAARDAFQAAVTAAPQDPDARASFALFLNYAGDSERALDEATRATELAPNDGHAFAVLCRVDDWSADFAAAARAGRQAVRLTQDDPLAHLFLAEALADTGRLSESQSEIHAARKLVAASPSAYLRAELQREEGNLAGDRGDAGAKLAAFKAASTAQPGWLYRTTEVVDALLGAGDDGPARELLGSAAGKAPQDPLLLRTLGSEAFGAVDAPLAADLWSRAAVLAGDDAEILEGAGEAAVAARGDINAGIAAFQAALRADPTDVRAAGYLLALARYVEHDPAAGMGRIATAVAASHAGHGQARPAPPDPAAAESGDAQRALADVNQARRDAGLAPVRLEARLNASAESHSYYWLFNNLSSTVAGLGIHRETPGLTGYSGQDPGTRALAFGYPNQRVAEDIDHRGDAVKSVDEWVNSVFHRFPILRPDLTVIGYGEAAAGPVVIEDLEFGFAPASPAPPVLYPGSGQQDVPAFFVDNELPDPVPAGQPRTTGSPVTVTFSPVDLVQVSSFTLRDASGLELDAYSAAPSASTENSAWLLPKAPLMANATYTAHIVATIGSRRYDRSWSFRTAPA